MPDLESAAAALSRQARTEARVSALLATALRGFLADMRAAVIDEGAMLTAARVSTFWLARINAALDSPQVDDEARAYIATSVAVSSIPTDAYGAAVALLRIANDEAWTAREMRAALAAVFVADAPALTAAGGRRQHRAKAKRSTASAPAEDAPSPTAAVAQAVKRKGPRNGADWAALDASAGGNWMAKMRRDARTAVTGLDGMLTTAELGSQGYTRRRWVTRHDNKVRDTHRAAEGQTVGLDEPFIVGGYALAYPGDSAGPAEEVINCRCVLVGVRWRDPDALI